MSLSPTVKARAQRRLIQPALPGSGVEVVDPRQLIYNATSERDLQQAIYDAARELGFLAYHPWSSKHSAKGFPDLVLIGYGACLAIELKSEKGKATEAQIEWLLAFQTVKKVYAFTIRPHQQDALIFRLRQLAGKL